MRRHDKRIATDHEGKQMTTRRLAQLDLDTGEVIHDGQLVYQPAKKRNGFQQGGWLAMAQTPYEAIAKSNLGLQAHRVLAMIIARLDFENWININQADLARELGMKPQNFGAALTRLIEEGIILKGPSVGNRKTYRLDPAYGWKGTAKNHRDALNARTKAAGLTVLEGGAK